MASHTLSCSVDLPPEHPALGIKKDATLWFLGEQKYGSRGICQALPLIRDHSSGLVSSPQLEAGLGEHPYPHFPVLARQRHSKWVES